MMKQHSSEAKIVFVTLPFPRANEDPNEYMSRLEVISKIEKKRKETQTERKKARTERKSEKGTSVAKRRQKRVSLTDTRMSRGSARLRASLKSRNEAGV